MSSLNLEVVEGPDAGLQVPLRGPVVIGREPGTDIRLNDSRVSRHHVRISPAEHGATVEDLRSSNGTFVNHAQVHGSVTVGPGDELLLGTSVLEVRSSDQIRSQPSAVRQIPPALATPQRAPTYVHTAEAAPASGPPELTRLLDVRVRAQARLAPLALLGLVALGLILYFGLR